MDSKASVFLRFTCNSSLNANSSLHFSSDNRIAAVTAKGVYVLSFVHRPNESGVAIVHKQFINNPNETLSFDIHASLREMIESMDEDEKQQIILDHTLVPNTANETLFRSYRMSVWSPTTAAFGSLLTLLTFDHRLICYREEDSQWLPLVDLSEMFYKKLDSIHGFEQLLFERETNKTYSQLKDIFHKAAIQCVVWTHCYPCDNKEVCFLICVTKSGYFTFFRFSFSDNDYSVDLVADWDSGLGVITVLHWYDRYLIIGTHNGQVQVVRPAINLSDKNAINIDMSPRVNPWTERDDIPVNHLVANSIDSSNFWIAFSKGIFVFVAKVSETLIAKKPIMILRSIVMKEAIYKLPSSGMCLLASNRFLVSSFDGRLVTIEIDKRFSMNQTELKIDNITVNNLCVYGLNSSSNQAIICIAQTLVTYHDHLSIKEATQISIVSLWSFESLTEKLTNLLNSEHCPSVKQLKDVLHCFCAYLKSGQLWIPQQLESSEVLTAMSDVQLVNKLKLLRYVGVSLLRFCVSYFDEQKRNSLLVSIASLEDIITKTHVEQLLFTQQSLDLTTNQKQSLVNCSLWLQMRWKSEIKLGFPLSSENCSVCGADIAVTDRSTAICPSNHRFARCSLSLLVCDVFANKSQRSLSCKCCTSAFYRSPCVWQKSFRGEDCLFCC